MTTSKESKGVLTKRWVAIFWLILVALQSVTVAADTHRFHPSQDHHLEFQASDDEHPHGDEDRTSAGSDNAGSNTSADTCQHCCHCHGSFHAIFSSQIPTIHAEPSQKFPAYLAAFTSAQPSTLFRPPKA